MEKRNLSFKRNLLKSFRILIMAVTMLFGGLSVNYAIEPADTMGNSCIYEGFVFDYNLDGCGYVIYSGGRVLKPVSLPEGFVLRDSMDVIFNYTPAEVVANICMAGLDYVHITCIQEVVEEETCSVMFEYGPVDCGDTLVDCGGNSYHFYAYSGSNIERYTWFVDSTFAGSGPFLDLDMNYYPYGAFVELRGITVSGCQAYYSVVLDNGTEYCVADFEYRKLLLSDTDSSNVDDLDSTYSINSYQFLDRSQGNIVHWSWYFDDESGSTERNPVHVFDQPGIYNVELIVYGNGMCSDTITKRVVVEPLNEACEADFDYFELRPTIDSSGYDIHDIMAQYGTYEFIDRSRGNINYREWHFGDGAFSNEINPIHQFEEGTYEVFLFVYSEDMMCSDTVVKTITVEYPETCYADFELVNITEEHPEFPSEYIGNSHLVYKAINNSVGDSLSFEWHGYDWSSSEIEPVIVFPGVGEYCVALSLWKDIGIMRMCNQTVECVVIRPPVEQCKAGFDFYNPVITVDTAFLSGYAGISHLIYQFVNYSEGDSLTYEWNFGDGTASNEYEPLHVFPRSGSYTVSLFIYNYDMSCFDSIVKVVHIDPIPEECIADFDYYEIDINDTLYSNGAVTLNTYQFIDKSQGDMNSWHWDFGDGNNSLEQNPIHTYEEPGIYFVELWAFADSEDCADSATMIIEVKEPVTCKAEFTYCAYHSIDPAAYDLPGGGNGNFMPIDELTIGFKNLSSKYTRYHWDFGDSTYSTAKNPVHKYSEPGVYRVCLTAISTISWCADHYCLDVYVGVPQCSADIRYEVLVPDCGGFNTAYQFRVKRDRRMDILDYYWSFGDGATSGEESPMHIYEEPGIYEASVWVLYADSCIAKDKVEIIHFQDSINIVYRKKCGWLPVKELGTTAGTSISKVYPMPASDKVTIDLMSDKAQQVNVDLIDALGGRVRLLDNYQVSEGENNIDILFNGLSSGTYVYILSTESKTLQGKICIIK